MNRTRILLSIVLLSNLAAPVYAGRDGSKKINTLPNTLANTLQLHTLTDRLLGFNDALADKGIELELPPPVCCVSALFTSTYALYFRT